MYAFGRYKTKTGERQRYRCEPAVGKAHTFSVVLTDDSPRRLQEPPPACPRGHSGKVERSNRYGVRPAEKRQQYKCIPDDGTNPHKFTAPLPRDHVHKGNADCAECRELRGIHRGETTIARQHSWPTRTVVRSLEKLANGESYTAVSHFALALDSAKGEGIRVRRNRAQIKWDEAKAAAEAAGLPVPKKEDRPDLKPAKKGDRWHIAADWCEAFSPVIWSDTNHRLNVEAEEARQAGAQIVWLIDSTSFGGRRKQGGKNGGASAERFALLSIAEQFIGAEGVNSTARLRLVRALPNRTTQAWQLVLSELGHAPDYIVSDADKAQLVAATTLFPQVGIIPCLWHLREALRKALDEVPDAHVMVSGARELHPDLDAHLQRMTRRDHVKNVYAIKKWWDEWFDLHARLRLPTDKAKRQRSTYEGYMGSAAISVDKHNKLPLSVGALEAIQNTVVRPTIAKRASGFANIERTNALLDLIVANQHGAFNDHNHVAELLREDALITGGHTVALRHVQDPQPPRGSYSSLRDPGLVADLAEQRGFA